MGGVTIQQVMLFATPSALAGMAILWATVHLVGKNRTASVRDGLFLELAMPPEWALDLAQAQFAYADWKPAPGDGAVNRQHVLPERPGLSVEAVARPGGGSDVHIWMSSWTLRQGVVRYAGVARRQMNALADVLAAADRSYEGPIPSSSHNQEVLDMLQARDGRRESSAA
jgi:hypothetical protein